MSFHEEPHIQDVLHRRTTGDAAAEFAIDLANEENLIGLARHEPSAPPEKLSDRGGAYYIRTQADRDAEEKTDAISDEQWEKFAQQSEPRRRNVFRSLFDRRSR